MLLMWLVFCSSAKGLNSIMVRGSDQYSESLGLESKLGPGFIYSLFQQKRNHS